MSRSLLVPSAMPPALSNDRGQLQPTAALVATVAVCLALGLYAVALGDATPATDRQLAEPTLDRVQTELTEGGIAVPAARDAARDAGPAGYRTNLTIRAAGQCWSVGPPIPRRADRAQTWTSVRVDADRVRTGTIRVGVWT